MIVHQASLVDEGAVSQGQAGQVNREKAVASEDCRQSVGEEDEGYGQDGVEPPIVQPDPVDGDGHGSTHHVAADGPQRHLLGEDGEERRRGGGRSGDEAHEADGEEDGHGVVAPGLQLQKRPQLPFEVDLFRPENGEDRCRVRRGDDGGEEEALQEGEVQGIVSRISHDDGGEEDPHRGEEDALPEDRPHLAPPGVQPSREEDEDQGHRPQGLGEPGVVEVDASGAVGSGEHPYHQEEEEGRHPQLGGRLAGDDAQKEQHRHSQEEVLEGYHRLLKVSDCVDISLSVMGIESSGACGGRPGGEGGGGGDRILDEVLARSVAAGLGLGI